MVEAVELLDRAGPRVEESLSRPGNDSRAGRLARTLRSLWPGAALVACRYRDAGRDEFAVLDATGSARPEWEGPLRAKWGDAEVPGPAGMELVTGSCESSGEWAVGFALGLPAGSPEDERAVARSLAGRCAREAARAARPDDDMADLGELAGPLAHEFNNVLNNLVLQVAVLEHAAPADVVAGLKEIRRQGLQVGRLVQQFQQSRRRPGATWESADLNRSVASATEAAGREPAPSGATPHEVIYEPDADLPRVAGRSGDVVRLCRFLVRNARRSGSAVRVGTESRTGVVVLRVAESGNVVPAETLAKLFDPSGSGRPGVNGLEMAACQSIVRRLGGRIRAEALPGGGLEVIAELPAAPPGITK
jgi:signal transduction histidine kinase